MILRTSLAALLCGVMLGCAAGSPAPPINDDPLATGGAGGDGSDATGGGGAGGMDNGPPADPTTCAEAEALRSYIGCRFMPTVTPNSVWSVFDYAVTVANSGIAPAQVDVTRGGELG